MSKFRIQTRQYGLALLGLTLIHGAALASDHQEAPLATSQLAADIGDYYAWHDGEDMNMVLTFGTFNAPGSPAIFSSDVLYGMHFDTSVPADGVSDRDIYARFAQNTAGEWGIQVFDDTGVLFETPVETVVESTNGKVWAGLSDDPFFFDLTGFNSTISTGTISFDPTRDDVAGLNISSLALQIPLGNLVTPGAQVSTWATTSTL